MDTLICLERVDVGLSVSTTTMKLVYKCPLCGLEVPRDKWQSNPEHPERRICQNQHKPVEMKQTQK